MRWSKAREKGLNWNFVTMEVHGVTDRPMRGARSRSIARASWSAAPPMAGLAWRVGKSLALAMVRPEHSGLGTELEIKILGKLFKATVIGESPFDPDNHALRA